MCHYAQVWHIIRGQSKSNVHGKCKQNKAIITYSVECSRSDPPDDDESDPPGDDESDDESEDSSDEKNRLYGQ